MSMGFIRRSGFRKTVLTHGISLAALVASSVVMTAEALPFKMFDTHSHFVTPDFAGYPLNVPPPIPGVPPNPATANLPERIARKPTNAERILSLWDANGVEAGVGVQYRTAYGINNTYLLDSARANPKRVIPIALLEALDPNTPWILRGMVHDGGVAGVRFSSGPDAKTGEYLWLSSPQAQKVWAAANELGVVIVLMPVPANTPDPRVLAVIAENARRYPNVRIVLDHFGWIPSQSAPDYGITPAHQALVPVKNIFFKFSSINIEALNEAKIPTADFLRHAVDVFGANRIMWGSDLGNSAGTFESLVEEAIAATAKLTPAERKWVLRDSGRTIHVAGGRGKAR
jgi:predicted TIM-barrel fold metal-dependent hydrolase